MMGGHIPNEDFRCGYLRVTRANNVVQKVLRVARTRKLVQSI